MLDQIRRLFAPPIFDDDQEKTRVARMLNVILWFCLLICLSSSISLLFSTQTILGALMIGGFLLLLIGMLFLLHRGYVQLAAWLSLLALWLAVTIVITITGGILSPETTGYIVVVMTAGLLSGVQTALMFAGLSMISACGVFFVEQQGWVDTSTMTIAPMGGLTIMLVNISMVTALLYLALTSLNNALRRARHNERNLLEKNRELQTIRASLEEQVVERTRGLEAAKEAAEAANQELAAQMWQVTGQAQLGDVMRGEQNLNTLANNVVGQLCQYLGAQVGALFLMQDGALELAGRYAYASHAGLTKRFKPGEGIVGQAARDRAPILVSDIPKEHMTIASGLGETMPKHILAIPFFYEGQVSGALELGGLAEFTLAEVEFLGKAIESVAIAFQTARARARIDELLMETQRQTEELQAQEEELRAANEELEAQTESLRTSEVRLREKQAELEALNAELQRQSEAA